MKHVVKADGSVELVPPSPEDVAQQAIDEAEHQARFARRRNEMDRHASYRSNAGRVAMLDRLRTSTPAQIDSWVDDNVGNIAQARAVLKDILKVIALDLRD